MYSPRSNPSTCLPGTLARLLAPPPLRTAYAVALAAEKQRDQSASGYRLYWMGQDRFGSFDVPVDPHVPIVVGRHGLCDVVLERDPTIALRHLLVRASRLDDGCPRLSVLDLHTNLGFSLADGRNVRSIVATGPIGLHVGAYAIVALPGGERMPPELPPASVGPALLGPYRGAAPPPSITLLPRASMLGESFSEQLDSLTLTLTCRRGVAVVHASAVELEAGVLVGRAPKCNDVLRTVLNDGISRVHLLLRRNVAYDLASTQGTYVRGQRVRSARIDEGEILQLGAACPVHLQVTKTRYAEDHLT